MNSFRQRLQQGNVLLGQMVLELFTPGIGPMLAACGLDFVIFDMEHGRCDISLLAEMVASCRGSEIFPIARVPDLAYAPLSRPLDVGARGVMVPRVETKQQAEDIVSQLKYAPMGRRGVALGIAHDLYRPGSAEFFAQANEEIAVILLLETEKALANMDEIVSVPGVDVAWIGHYDLTVSLGIPAQFDFWPRWTVWSPHAAGMASLRDFFRPHLRPPCIGSAKVSAPSVWGAISASFSMVSADFKRT
jgi:2-keto-3-deoxy-L-rhamnonate aldolase RhmA